MQFEYDLTPNDIDLIANLKVSPDAEVFFDNIRAALIWSDERVWNGLTPSAYELMIDLVIARNFLFHYPQCGLRPFLLPGHSLDRWKEVWAFGHQMFPNWPGFSRCQLAEKEKEMLIQEQEQNSEI